MNCPLLAILVVSLLVFSADGAPVTFEVFFKPIYQINRYTNCSTTAKRDNLGEKDNLECVQARTVGDIPRHFHVLPNVNGNKFLRLNINNDDTMRQL